MPKRTIPLEPIQTPAGLSERAAALWNEVVPLRVWSPERRALLEDGLRARDRADAARELLHRDGLLVKSERSGLEHPHPALRVLEAAEAAFSRAWRRLELDTVFRTGNFAEEPRR